MSFPQDGQAGQVGQDGGQQGQGPGGPPGDNYWQQEAKRAFGVRDAAKSEADQLRRQVAELNQRLQVVQQKATQMAHGSLRLAVENAAARTGNLVPTALPDVVEAITRRVAVGEDLLPVIVDEYGNPRPSPNDPGRAMSLDEAVAEYVGARPHLRRAFAPVGSGAPMGSTGGVPRVFDVNRLDDPLYAKSWKEQDPEGFKAAWKEHLKRVAARPIRTRA